MIERAASESGVDLPVNFGRCSDDSPMSCGSLAKTAPFITQDRITLTVKTLCKDVVQWCTSCLQCVSSTSVCTKCSCAMGCMLLIWGSYLRASEPVCVRFLRLCEAISNLDVLGRAAAAVLQN